jgi:hypothetical protein
MVLHLLIHLVENMAYWGPVSTFWMFPFERFIGYLNKNTRNRLAPEANMIMFHRINLFSKILAQSHVFIKGDDDDEDPADPADAGVDQLVTARCRRGVQSAPVPRMGSSGWQRASFRTSGPDRTALAILLQHRSYTLFFLFFYLCFNYYILL